MSSPDRHRPGEPVHLLEPSNLLEPLDLTEREPSALPPQARSATAYARFGNPSGHRPPLPPNQGGPNRSRRPALLAVGALVCFAAGASLPVLASKLAGSQPALATADPPGSASQRATKTEQTASTTQAPSDRPNVSASAKPVAVPPDPGVSAPVPNSAPTQAVVPDRNANGSSRVAVQEQPPATTPSEAAQTAGSFWQATQPTESRPQGSHMRKRRHPRPAVQDQAVGEASADQSPATDQADDNQARRTLQARGHTQQRMADQASAGQQASTDNRNASTGRAAQRAQSSAADHADDDQPGRTRQARSRPHERVTDQASADQQTTPDNGGASSARTEQRNRAAARQAGRGPSRTGEDSRGGEHPFGGGDFFSFLFGGDR